VHHPAMSMSPISAAVAAAAVMHHATTTSSCLLGSSSSKALSEDEDDLEEHELEASSSSMERQRDNIGAMDDDRDESSNSGNSNSSDSNDDDITFQSVVSSSSLSLSSTHSSSWGNENSHHHHHQAYSISSAAFPIFSTSFANTNPTVLSPSTMGNGLMMSPLPLPNPCSIPTFVSPSISLPTSGVDDAEDEDDQEDDEDNEETDDILLDCRTEAKENPLELLRSSSDQSCDITNNHSDSDQIMTSLVPDNVLNETEVEKELDLSPELNAISSQVCFIPNEPPLSTLHNCPNKEIEPDQHQNNQSDAGDLNINSATSDRTDDDSIIPTSNISTSEEDSGVSVTKDNENSNVNNNNSIDPSSPSSSSSGSRLGLKIL